MTQLNFTVDMKKILEDISGSNLNEMTKGLLTLVLNQVMQEERDEYMGIGSYERNSSRKDYRNGSYRRGFTTLVGKIELEVPRTRSGEFSPQVFEKWQRKDQALVLSLIEMVVSGVSTRKVTKIVEELVGESVSKSFVSNVMKRLDPEIQDFAERSLTHNIFKYVSVDAMYIKVRENHRIVSKAVYIALGIGVDGHREVLGFKVDDAESKNHWGHFLRDLKNRGLTQPELITSDSHQGLKQAIQEEFPGTPWQRCTVHFLRNITNVMPKKGSTVARQLLREIFHTTTPQHAREAKEKFLDFVSEDPRFNHAVEILESGFDDAIQCLMCPAARQKFLKSTNALERLNSELRRRERVVRVFPNIESAFRLIGALLLDANEAYKETNRKVSAFVEAKE
ncbi:IS256 family transposase [Nosocomiicoccus massiliensis]|uniref:Mutator family transposase n=4 Tax=Nosocomiicoccus TaxID=489909 RepID=A0AAF0YH16_9STAP|nr:IS256 family transposase [Nosocomiicoccus massiliensis]WOS95471.1 IS256 family transposase [Nosocomiicoccus massiliensis]WOS96060.1 IS256 family transposase [Nosocomiicoccus massiliensis]